MAADFTVRGGAMELINRDAERDTLDRLIAAVRAGESRALVVSAKRVSARPRCLITWPSRLRDAGLYASRGVQSEMELAFAALHQLCAPPAGQASRDYRSRSVMPCGLRSARAQDRYRTGSWSGWPSWNLLSDAAEQQPLVCVVDDEQWLDRASAQVLGFVARRLVAESVGMVFAARDPSSDIAGLSELTVEGLPEADARALLDSALSRATGH